MTANRSNRLVVGKVNGLYGVRGWIKLLSWTEPREQILSIPSWQLWLEGEWRQRNVAEGRQQGKTIIARLEGISDRDQAVKLLGAEIAVAREQLPPLRPGEYYWADLIGLDVQLPDGRSLGQVDSMMATGANDVLVVKGDRERLIPFIRDQVVREVDLDKGLIQVDWDPEF